MCPHTSTLTVALAGRPRSYPARPVGGSILQWGAAKGLTARCFPAASEALRAQDHAARPGLVAAHPGLTKYGTPDFAGPDDQPGTRRRRAGRGTPTGGGRRRCRGGGRRRARRGPGRAAGGQPGGRGGAANAARLYWDTDLTVSEIAALLGLPPAHKRTVYRLAGPRIGECPPLRLPASHP